MRLLQSQPTSPRLLGLHKPLSEVGLVILFLIYWWFALQIEQIDYVPRLFATVTDIMRLFGAIFNPLVRLIEGIAPYFSLRVLRHLIPLLVGWFLARQAILGLIQSFYDLPDSEAAAALLYRLSLSRIGFVKPAVITQQNFDELKQIDPLLKIGGPGRIVVSEDAALVTELNGRFCRVIGPGRHDLERFEFPRTIIDLRPQEREVEDIKLMTSDGIEISTSISVTFQILRWDEQPTSNKPFPYDQEAVRVAAYTETVQPDGSIGRWESLPILVASGQLRAIVAEDRLDDLIVPDTNAIDVHRRLQMEMERRARNILRGFGVMIRGTRLGTLELPEEVENLRKKYWQAQWEILQILQLSDEELLDFAREKPTIFGDIPELFPRAKPADLRVFLIKYFNESELQDICFDLNVDYESLPGYEKNAKARELVSFCQRRGEYDLLLKKCYEKRPKIYLQTFSDY